MTTKELTQLKKCIDKALKSCQKDINKAPDIVLSEADFERLLSNRIEDQIQEFKPKCIVRNQISHYNTDNTVNARVDIIIMRKEEIIEKDKVNKGFINLESCFVLELKYLHKAYIRYVEKDIDKRSKIKDKDWLYVVPLFEESDDDKFKAFEDKVNDSVRKYKEENPEKKDILFHRVLRKDKNKYDK